MLRVHPHHRQDLLSLSPSSVQGAPLHGNPRLMEAPMEAGLGSTVSDLVGRHLEHINPLGRRREKQ